MYKSLSTYFVHTDLLTLRSCGPSPPSSSTHTHSFVMLVPLSPSLSRDLYHHPKSPGIFLAKEAKRMILPDSLTEERWPWSSLLRKARTDISPSVTS